MHVENELVEFVPTREQEYEEEVLVQEEAPQLLSVQKVTNT